MKTPAEYKEMEFIELLIVIAKLFKPKVYMELGTKRGYTIRRMAQFVERAIGVDIRQLELDLPNVTTITGTTQAYAESLANSGEFIDMLFIDADHSYEAAYEDFLKYLPLVRSGTGLIMMHDTHPVMPELAVEGHCGTAWKAARKIHLLGQDKLNVEIVTLPGPWAGLSIIRKLGDFHLAWQKEGEDGA
jgi:predicted O-methyltransferase YrrM